MSDNAAVWVACGALSTLFGFGLCANITMLRQSSGSEGVELRLVLVLLLTNYSHSESMVELA